MPDMAEGTLLAPYFLSQLFKYEPEDNYLYLNNAKAACSTIKESLLIRNLERQGRPIPDVIRTDMIHGRGFWMRDYNRVVDSRPFTFSVVRNPFTRLLSCYQDKFERKNFRIFPRFCQRYGLPTNRKVTFIDFLRYIDGDDETVMDQHWRPQVQNLFINSIPVDMVVRLETLKQNQSALEERLGFAFKGGLRNQRKSSSTARLEDVYTDEAEEIVRRVFREDFETFGYSDRLADVREAPAGLMSFLEHDPLDESALRACSYLEANEAKAAQDVLTQAAYGNSSVVHALLLNDAKLDRTTAEEVEADLQAITLQAEAGRPVANHLAAAIRLRLAHLKGGPAAIARATLQLNRHAAFTRLPALFRRGVSDVDARPGVKRQTRKASSSA